MYFMTVAYHAYRARTRSPWNTAIRSSFATSDYAKPAEPGNYFDKYTDDAAR